MWYIYKPNSRIFLIKTVSLTPPWDFTVFTNVHNYSLNPKSLMNVISLIEMNLHRMEN